MSRMDPGEAPSLHRAAVVRAVLFLVFWLAISGWKASALPVGLVATAAATWASLVLMPPIATRLRLGALPVLALHFLRCSVIAGFDVARRALSPNLDLNPGFIVAPLRLTQGDSCNAFCALASLAPGSLPVAMDGDALLIHCLDVAQPVARDLAAQETLFMRTLHDE